MASYEPAVGDKRTAILVVHGIGSQRALETVRGVIRGIWQDHNNPADKENRIWLHPEKDYADIDLSVLTTSKVLKSADGRAVDFHELYWAHLMSETKAVAVLLWLYELSRKGPIMKLGMNAIWWAAAIFLCLMNLSFAVLVLHGVFLLSQSSAQNMLVAPFLLLFACILLGLYVAAKWKADRLIDLLKKPLLGSLILIAIYVLIGLLFPVNDEIPDIIELVTKVALPTLIALIATALIMGQQGLRAFWRALLVSLVLFLCFILADRLWHPDAAFTSTMTKAWIWGLGAPWSVAAASAVIGLYLIVNAAFLQPYLGDAARYFRGSPGNVAVRRAIRKEAVDMLARLHESGQYDRIVVVAHSLGTVVAYDMLRAYFSRISSQLPPVAKLGRDFRDIDDALWQPQDKNASIDDKKALRRKARAAVADIATVAAAGGHKSWLVTDFVTLGSALTHAYFLMCQSESEPCEEKPGEPVAQGQAHAPPPDAALQRNFARRVREREFPTCPPKRLDQDGLLTFENRKAGERQIHNGAVFGLTRWTNIYFPRIQLFWGDAIGGPLSPIFGYHIVDRAVWTNASGTADFFTHTAYWDVERKPDTYNAPHIVTLRKAVDLAENEEAAINIVDDGSDPDLYEGK